MRAICDERETIVEFSSGDQPEFIEEFRLILRRGSRRFLIERLTADEARPWIWRWEPWGRGKCHAGRVTRHQLDGDHVTCAMPQFLIAAIEQAFEYVRTGTRQSLN
jgi:hypothetical protein